MMEDFYYGSIDSRPLTLPQLKDEAYNRDYDYVPNFVHHRTESEIDDDDETCRLYGIELEVCTLKNLNDSAYHALKILNKNSRNFYIKRDGSVSRGFEINSHPMTLKYMMENFTKDKWEEVVKNSKLHIDSSCGFHVHMCRDNFKKGSISIMHDYFVVLKPLILTISNRVNMKQVERYAKYFETRDDDNSDLNNAYRKSKDYVSSTFKSLKHTKKISAKLNKFEIAQMSNVLQKNSFDSRYTALNNTNSETLEVRIFSGSIEHSYISNIVKFLDHLTTIANNKVELLSIDDFLKTLKEGTELKEFVFGQYNKMLKQMKLVLSLINNKKLISINDMVGYRIPVDKAKDDDYVVVFRDSVPYFISKGGGGFCKVGIYINKVVTVLEFGVDVIKEKKDYPIMVIRALPFFMRSVVGENGLEENTLNCLHSCVLSFYASYKIEHLANLSETRVKNLKGFGYYVQTKIFSQ